MAILSLAVLLLPGQPFWLLVPNHLYGRHSIRTQNRTDLLIRQKEFHLLNCNPSPIGLVSRTWPRSLVPWPCDHGMNRSPHHEKALETYWLVIDLRCFAEWRQMRTCTQPIHHPTFTDRCGLPQPRGTTLTCQPSLLPLRDQAEAQGVLDQ